MKDLRHKKVRDSRWIGKRIEQGSETAARGANLARRALKRNGSFSILFYPTGFRNVPTAGYLSISLDVATFWRSFWRSFSYLGIRLVPAVS